MNREPRQRTRRLACEGLALRDQIVAEAEQPDILRLVRDLAQEPCGVQPVLDPEQRGAIRTLGAEHAIDEEVTRHRECATDQPTGADADRLSRQQQGIEARAQVCGVCRDLAQRGGRERISEARRLARGLDVRVLLGLRELATEFAAKVREVIDHGEATCSRHASAAYDLLSREVDFASKPRVTPL